MRQRVVGILKVKGVDHVSHVLAAPGCYAGCTQIVAVCCGPSLKKHDVRGVIASLRKDVAATRPRRDDKARYTRAWVHG